jgi:hypothetical protein
MVLQRNKREMHQGRKQEEGKTASRPTAEGHLQEKVVHMKIVAACSKGFSDKSSTIQVLRKEWTALLGQKRLPA